jgi:dienelactone hydrolase
MRIEAAALAAALLLAAPAPAPAQERVTFDSRDGDLTGGKPTRIEAILTRPDGPGPHPAVVALHGCGGLYATTGSRAGQVQIRDLKWVERFHGLGFVVLQPDSFGPRGAREVCTQKERTIDSRRERPRDAHGALAWLAAQPFVDPRRIFLLGWSHGGGTTLATVAADAPGRVDGVDFRAGVAFYPGCSDPAKSSWARGWRTRMPLLILNGELDDWTPIAPCRALLAAKADRRVELVAYPGAYHDFDAPGSQVRVREGLGRAPGGKAHLGPEPAARADAFARVPEWIAARLR